VGRLNPTIDRIEHAVRLTLVRALAGSGRISFLLQLDGVRAHLIVVSERLLGPPGLNLSSDRTVGLVRRKYLRVGGTPTLTPDEDTPLTQRRGFSNQRVYAVVVDRRRRGERNVGTRDRRGRP